MSIRQRIVQKVRAVNDVIRRPQFVSAGHFYSPINSSEDIDRALGWKADIPGIEFDEDKQISTFRELIPLFDGVPPKRYRSNNGMYDLADASIYQAFARRAQPKRVLEVGSGFSTAKLLDTADEVLPGLKITCIEPYPERLFGLMLPGDGVELIRSPVQEVPIDVFTSLESGDILFIDSTHVAKAGSDVVWLYLHVLPRLREGVLVHIHDIFWPFEYPAEWLRAGRCWNEDYFLQAFLCQNNSWSIELFSSWVWQKQRQLVPESLRTLHPGSIWLRRR